MIKRVSKVALNSPSFWSVFSAGTRAGGALITLPITLTVLEANEIGLYYLFLALIAFAEMLNLGFHQTLVRFSAQAASGATHFEGYGVPKKGTSGHPNLALLTELFSAGKTLYAYMGIAITLVSSCLMGMFVWQQISSTEIPNSIFYCWVALSVATGMVFYSGIWRIVLFGYGDVNQAHKSIVLAYVTSTVTAIAALLLGLGLWSFPIAKVVHAITDWAFSNHCLRKHIDTSGIRFNLHGQLIMTMWPTAWRQATVAFGEFLENRAGVIICSILFGLELTAEYGLTLQILGVLGALSIAPLAVITPAMNQLRVQQDLAHLKTFFLSRAYAGILSFVLCSSLFAIWGAGALKLLGVNTLVLPHPLFLLLLLNVALSLHKRAWMLLVLTENKNPFVATTLITGIVTIIASYTLGISYGVIGMILGQLIIPLLHLYWWPIVRGVSGLKNARPN